MTPLFQARRRVEDFAAAVDGTAGRHARGGEISTLLEVVAALRDQAPVEPRPEFAQDLRTRLMLEAETALEPGSATLLLPVRQRGPRERRLAAAAAAFVLVGGTTTMAAAAQSALPGDVLYPIKRGIERAEAELNLSPAGKGEDLLDQASDRLVEVEGLLATPSSRTEPRVPETLEEFSGTAAEGSELMFEAFNATGDPDTIVTVRTFTAEAIATLEGLAAEVPAEAQGELTAAAVLMSDIDSEAASLCSGCAPELPLVEVPGVLLARAEVDRALDLAGSRELDNNHPVVVPKDTAGNLREATGIAPPPAPADDPTTDAAPAPAPALPSPTWQPEEWPKLLPGIEADTGTGTGTTTKNDDGAVGDVTDTLGDAVETILPDTGSLLD